MDRASVKFGMIAFLRTYFRYYLERYNTCVVGYYNFFVLVKII